ncbi:MAG: hypothetical protein C5S44_00225 [Candidatus Methanocomedens sp.]|nr:MAG: hypothetical protein C5S44_00225 [ANME-2 cluster archaeon]
MSKPSTNNSPDLLKALKYEVMRLAYNKKYFYMLLIESLFASYILMSFVSGGKDGTAPFSKWTYSQFLTSIGPLLSIILVMLCISVFSEKEIAVRKIIFSAPLSESKYYLLKASAITAVLVFTASVPILLSFAYYAYYFNFYAYAEFLLPILLFLLPSQVLVLGLALVAGRINSGLLYLLLPVVFLGSLAMKFPVWFDLFGINFLSLSLRRSLGVFEGPIPYTLPGEFLYSRLIFIFVGVCLLALACRGSKKYQ